ncbi:MAG: glycosyltransferase [Acidobacteriota bacterium]
MTPSPRKILVVIGSLEVGGAERQIVEIARLLQGPDFQFHVVTTAAGGPLEAPLRATGATCETLGPPGAHPPRSKSERAWRAVRNAAALRGILRRRRPDLIHSYLTETSAIAAAARWPGRAPFHVYSKRSLVRWIAREAVYFPLVKWTNARADLILANSHAVAEESIRKEGTPAAKIRVVHNGVDTDLYRPGPRSDALAGELGIPAGSPVVGMIANLHLYKGHADVLRACASWGQPDLRLVFVGREGNASDSVRRLVAELGLAERVVFTGPRTDVPELLRLFDVFVSASHEEGFSNSILEAMASGCGIVATAVGGTVEQIEDGKSGCLVPPEDPAAIERALRRLFDTPDFLAKVRGNARARAVERFSLAALRDAMAEIYGAVRPG